MPGVATACAVRRRRLTWAAFGLLAIVVLLSALVQARDDSPTFDEPVYVSAGLLALTQHDVAYNAEHPPLAKAIAALPVLLTPYTLPPGHASGINDEKAYAATFLKAQGDHLQVVTFASRLVPTLELLLVGVLLVMLGRQLVGIGGGLVAGALWLVSPVTGWTCRSRWRSWSLRERCFMPGTTTTCARLCSSGWRSACVWRRQH